MFDRKKSDSKKRPLLFASRYLLFLENYSYYSEKPKGGPGERCVTLSSMDIVEFSVEKNLKVRQVFWLAKAEKA